jgi:hypothetical protein
MTTEFLALTIVLGLVPIVAIIWTVVVMVISHYRDE